VAGWLLVGWSICSILDDRERERERIHFYFFFSFARMLIFLKLRIPLKFRRRSPDAARTKRWLLIENEEEAEQATTSSINNQTNPLQEKPMISHQSTIT